MEKVKSYLKDIQNNEKYQKDIEFLEKKVMEGKTENLY